MKRVILFLAVLLLLATFSFAQQPAGSSEQSTNPPAQPAAAAASAPQSDKAIVYFYRYKQFSGSALSPSVFCDDAQLARMENGRYFRVKLDPGKHTFHSNDKQSGAELELKAGQEYFLRVEIATGFMKGHGRLVVVAPEQAKYELKAKNLKPLDPDKVVDKERVSLEPIQTAEAAKPQDAPPSK